LGYPFLGVSRVISPGAPVIGWIYQPPQSKYTSFLYFCLPPKLPDLSVLEAARSSLESSVGAFWSEFQNSRLNSIKVKAKVLFDWHAIGLGSGLQRDSSFTFVHCEVSIFAIFEFAYAFGLL
jgi:hypothetical protein